MSPAQLREGAEQTAAACTFSGRSYVLVTEGTALDSAVSLAEVLPHWTPQEHRRLLGTAIFDDATYGRVEFHHRAVREYLAACWVERRLGEGLPLAQALGLFLQAPFGDDVLLKSRRPTLCWLADRNAKVRERVIRQFPEMLMFEGDPQSWSTDDVVDAFEGYIRKLASGYRPDWWSWASELRRVARVVPADLLGECIGRYVKSQEVLYQVLRLINYGKVTSCADAVFALYCHPETSDESRQDALVTLGVIATPDQRHAIQADLVAGKLQSNALIAAALRVIGLQALTVEKLTAILRRVQPESAIDGGAVERALKIDLVPAADLQALQTLLMAILRALDDHPVQSRRYRAAAGMSEESWMLSVLPDCFRRAVDLMGDDGTVIPQVLVDVALWMENLQHSEYVFNVDYQALGADIGKHPEFRRRIARAIARSEEVGSAVYYLTWRGLVACTQEDLDWLVREASREDIDPQERRVWYKVARHIAFSLHGRPRQQVLAALTNGVDGPARAEDIKTYRAQRVENSQRHRNRRREERARKAERRRQLEESKTQLLREIAGIRDGNGFSAIQRLFKHAATSSNVSTYTKVNLEPIGRDFGHELAEAFSAGMTKVWQHITVPNPADYPANRIPLTGLIGLASVHHAVAMGLEVRNLSAEDITRAVQLCVWEIDRPEPWLDALAGARADTVVSALMPWFEHELKLAADGERSLRTVDVILRTTPSFQRPFLQRAMELIRDGAIYDARLQLRLFRALIEADIASQAFIATTASRHLLSGAHAEQPAFASEWFRAWVEVDLAAAWSWLETNRTTIAKDDADLATLVAEGLKRAQWTKGLAGTEAEVTTLVSLVRFLSVHADTAPSEPDAYEGPARPASIRHVRDSILRALTSMPGQATHAVLRELAVENAGTARGHWLQGLVLEHASAEAERHSVVPAQDLPHIGEVYCRQPRTERELYEQVIARLQEIQDGIEGGPFSDRVLFTPGMDEKKLQLWLAARLSDTPLRRFIPRFRVHREPHVDEDKRTDIEVSSAAGKVCIEVKPVDSTRGYTAKSLTETLQDQLVGQYLRGQNSKHGILVVFRLDTKKWRIPDGPARGDFDELVEYLAAQAATIAARSNNVEALTIIGIDCVSAKPSVHG